MSDRSADESFMAEALELAHSHLGQTGTNPSVGCVFVKDGVVVGRGVTAVSGRPHAETQALAEAGEAARGATAYVTLEPCSHHGKTPPCADALIAAGVARVVVAIRDPDERVSGNGIRRLEDSGIEVELGVLAKEAEHELAAYLMRKRQGRAHVTLKMAVSRDGKIGRSSGGQVFITGPEAKNWVHQLRSKSDAILVGLGTVLSDDPELTCRLPGLFHLSPVRVVLDRKLEMPLGSKLVRGARDVPLLVVCQSDDTDEDRARALEDAGAEVLVADSLLSLLEALATRGISSLLVEGGAKVASTFLEQGLVDRIYLFSSEVVVGDGGVPSPLQPGFAPAGFHIVQQCDVGLDRLTEFEKDI